MVDAVHAEGYAAIHAPDVPSGLARVHEAIPAAVLVDILMPNLAGWDLIRQFTASPDTAAIPLLVVSAVNGQVTGFLLGAATCVTRPIERDELLAALAHVQRSDVTGAVLVVDEDPGEREALRGFLAGEGLPVARYEGGAEAVDWLRGHVPGLVLLSQVSGFEVLQTLRSDPRLAQVPIVFLCVPGLDHEQTSAFQAYLLSAIQRRAVPTLSASLRAALS
jgi:CheY-like chemotaxis protein